MTHRLVRYYGTLDPYEIPTVIGLPIIFIATPLLVYSIYSVHIDLFIKFGGILGSVYWPILIYLSIETYRSQKRPWSFWQKFVWWQTVIASPFIAAIIGAFYFGIFYPIWNAINWLSENSTPSIWIALLIGVSTLIIGTLLFLFRIRARAIYGTTEVMAGILVATHRSYSSPDLIAIVNTEFLLFLLTAGIYLVVRGLDNIHTGITKEPRDIVYTRLQNWWKNIGHQNLRIQQLSEETASTNPLVVNTRNTREK